MATTKNATLKAFDGVIQASIAAREALRQSETVLRRMRRRLEKGSSIAEAFAGLAISDHRQATFDRLTALEHARREARRAIIALGVSEGLSLGQMARQWGVSRQLVTRLAKESRRREPATNRGARSE
jgi:hypothetical protein